MNELLVEEISELQHHETTIEQGLKTFVDVGNALLAIRDKRLYRQSFGTFEDYCQDRWSMERNYANKLIAAAVVVENLGTIVPVLPATESQARPLTRLEPELQPVAWQRAVETAPNGKVTAAHVEATAKTFLPPNATPIRLQPTPVSSARTFVAPYAPSETARYIPAQRPAVDEYGEMEEEAEEDGDGYDWTEETVAEESPAKVEYDSNEWYTPLDYISAARQVLGDIDLDPASCQVANEKVKATEYYDVDDDGLTLPWNGRIWLNPPYGDPLPWVEKLTSSFREGTVTAALLLVNTANSPQWSRLLWNGPYAVCLLSKRVRFWRPDRADAKGTAQDQMIWYMGDDPEKFKAVFSMYGAIR